MAGDRQRYGARQRANKQIYSPLPPLFVNPYSNMPAAEARIYLALSQRRIPFAWRWFDGSSVFLRTLLPGWVPEFTIRGAKTIILIHGAFFGNVPSVIDRNALAKAVLEREGWKVIILHEYDILAKGADRIVESWKHVYKLWGRGGVKKNPHGAQPDIMEQFRRMRLSARRVYSANTRVVVASSRRRPSGRVRRPSSVPGFVVGRRYRRTYRENQRRRIRR